MGAFRKISVPVEGSDACETQFQCTFAHPDGAACHKAYAKSTSLIFHYQRHIDLKPFVCAICGDRFTQPGTLARHSRAVHQAFSIGTK